MGWLVKFARWRLAKLVRGMCGPMSQYAAVMAAFTERAAVRLASSNDAGDAAHQGLICAVWRGGFNGLLLGGHGALRWREQ